MGIRSVVTRGFGSGGSAALAVTRGYTPAPPVAATPGGTFRRPPWSWDRVFAREAATLARTFRRALPTLARVWRWVVPTNTLPVQELTKPASEDRDYGIDFSKAPELASGTGITLASATVSGGTGLTLGTPTVLAGAFDGIPAGKGFSLRISGGLDDATYSFAVLATLSNGRKLVVPCKLAVTADYE
jgi:hypothetical protein